MAFNKVDRMKDEDVQEQVNGGTSSTVRLTLSQHPGAGSRLYGACNDDINSKQGSYYSWCGLNVHVSGDDTKRRSWRLPWCGSRRSQPSVRKHILKDAFGEALPGEMLAIMGSSGAGKTTLLNALTFRLPVSATVTGKRTVGNVPADRSRLAALGAYVQQDDLFLGSLTVKEHLIFQALLRMDRGISYQRRMQRVDEVITEVLTDPPMMLCDEPTSGLDSFMALNAISVLKGMASKGKTVICTIHQPSSEVFAMFDKVLLVAEGRVAFLGTTQEAFAFFARTGIGTLVSNHRVIVARAEDYCSLPGQCRKCLTVTRLNAALTDDLGAVCPSNYNPADFFIQLLAVVPTREENTRKAINMVCDAFKTSAKGIELLRSTSQTQSEYSPDKAGSKLETNWGDMYQNNGGQTVTPSSPYKASWVAQFRAVLWRSVRSVLKEPSLIRVRTTQTLMVSLMIVLIYYGQTLDQDGVMNINGVIFICLTNMTFQNIFAVVNVFSAEMPIFMREHLNAMYRTDVYFLSKTLAELPLFLFLPILFLSVPYYLIGLNPDPIRFANALFVITLVANVATSFGYFISCISDSIGTALAIGPPIVIPFMLFGGFFLNNDSVPSYLVWLSYLSWFKYGDEALLINQWSGVENIACTRENSTCPRNGSVVLESLSFNENNYWFDIVALFLLIILFRVLAFSALLYKTYRRH